MKIVRGETGRNYNDMGKQVVRPYPSIIIFIVNWLNSSIKTHTVTVWIMKQEQTP